MLNRDISRRLLTRLNAMPGVKAIKLPAGVALESGTPDVVACVQGRMVMIEVKRSPSDKPTPVQQLRLAQWAKAGAVVIVAYDCDQVLDAVKEMLAR